MKTKEMTKNSKAKKATAVALTLALIVGAVGATYSYFTDHHTAMNEFTVGEVKSALTETKWDGTGKTAASELRPNMTIEKDPVIENTGTSDSYNFIAFRVPYGKFAALGAFNGKGQCTNFDGTATTKVNTAAKDLFKHEVNADWVLVEDTAAGDYHEYVYAHATGDKSTGAMTPLSKTQKTPALFVNDKIRTINLVEDEWALQKGCIATENKKFNIPVRTYSIQTTDLTDTDGAGKHDPATVWATVKAQVNAKYAGMAEGTWGNTMGANNGNGNDGTYGAHDHANRTAADAAV